MTSNQHVSKATDDLTRLGSVMVDDLDTAAGRFVSWRGYTDAWRMPLINELLVRPGRDT